MITTLIVDDSSTTRSLIRSMIEEIDDFSVFEAASGFEALKILPAQAFDLIMIDINMPDINGLELISFIKDNDNLKNIPVIIISTERSEEDVKKGIKLGAFAYLPKPFKAEELQGIVRKALGL